MTRFSLHGYNIHTYMRVAYIHMYIFIYSHVKDIWTLLFNLNTGLLLNLKLTPQYTIREIRLHRNRQTVKAISTHLVVLINNI